PVSDPAGEVVYVRDDETGEVWSATALPIRQDSETYVARHGQGYSRFTHRSHGVAFELLQLVPLDDPVKICRLPLTNASGRRRTRRRRVLARPGGVSRGGNAADRALSRMRRRGGAGGRRVPLGRGARRRAGLDARSQPRRPAQPLAALPDARLSGLGAVRLLSGRWPLRF